jgi:hypothetical protein
MFLLGPIPNLEALVGELSPNGFEKVFKDVPRGNYIVTASGCTVYGCLIETPATVDNADVGVQLRNIGVLGPPSPPPFPTNT